MQVRTGVELRPRHIVWDWNGTILDDNDAVVSAVAHCLPPMMVPGE